MNPVEGHRRFIPKELEKLVFYTSITDYMSITDGLNATTQSHKDAKIYKSLTTLSIPSHRNFCPKLRSSPNLSFVKRKYVNT